LIGSSGFCQGLQVLISEKKKGRRIVLMAENMTNDTLNVFFMVNADGYRRSASKPVIKDIPPKTKLPMITLIELQDVPSQYTYDLIINKEKRNLNFTYEKQAKDIQKLIEGKLVIFTTSSCEKCELLAQDLQKKRISHRVLNITEDAILYNQFMRLIERDLTEETRIRFPVIWNKDRVIFGYDVLEIILTELDN
jgi:glutaredoxin-related protein